jgi:hypothetical protein
MYPKGSSLYSQKPTIEICPEPIELSAHLHTIFSEDSINIILLSGFKSQKCSFVSLRFSDENFEQISHFPYACYMPHTPHPLDLITLS